MAEETNKEWEGVNPNSTGSGQEWEQSQEWQKTTFTLDEVEAMKKEMQSNSDRGVQKILKTQQRLEKMLDAVAEVSADPEKLLAIHDQDPEIAKAILDKYYNWQTLEEFQEDFDIKIDYNDPVVKKRVINQEAERIANERSISEKKEEFIAKLNMTPDQVDAFNEAFDERKWLKSFSIKDLTKHFEKAYIEVDWDSSKLKELEKQAAIGKSQASPTGTWNSSKQENPLKKNREESKSFLSKFGI